MADRIDHRGGSRWWERHGRLAGCGVGDGLDRVWLVILAMNSPRVGRDALIAVELGGATVFGGYQSITVVDYLATQN